MFTARSFLDAGVKIAAHNDHVCASYPSPTTFHFLVNGTTKAGRFLWRIQWASVLEAVRPNIVNAHTHSSMRTALVP